MQSIPQAEFFPVAESTVSGAAGTAQLARNILPAGPGRQDEPDHTQGDPVADAGSAARRPDRRLRRQMVGDQIVKLGG